MKKAVFSFGLIFLCASFGLGQVRTITNSTLQKFQQKRLDAERDYRDNYARMGFPSPEELDRQRDADMTARLQLADQLRQARLERERIELERQGLMLQAAALEREREDSDGYNNGFYGGYFGGFGGFYSNGGFYDGRFGARRGHFGGFDRFGRFYGGGYRATPVGVYPTPIRRTRPLVFRSPTRAIIRTGRH